MTPLEIKNIRKELGLNQTEFGEMLGVGIRTVQLWEKGKREISGKAKRLLKTSLNEEKIISDSVEDLLLKKIEGKFKGEIGELKEMIQSLQQDIQLINRNSMLQRNSTAKKERENKKKSS